MLIYFKIFLVFSVELEQNYNIYHVTIDNKISPSKHFYMSNFSPLVKEQKRCCISLVISNFKLIIHCTFFVLSVNTILDFIKVAHSQFGFGGNKMLYP